VRRALAALAAGLLLAAPAGAEVRRYEVVGAIAVDPAKPIAAPRQAALRAALLEAVGLAARNVVAEETGAEPKPGDPPPALEGEPSEYAVSYRVLEDRGEQARMLTAAEGQGGREYVVLAEVQIDLGRVRERLRASGTLGIETVAAPAGPFQLEILAIPSPAVWTAVRVALIRAGARTVLPIELEAGRTLVSVDGPIPADRIVERILPTELPGGLGLESLPAEAGPRRLRVREVPPPTLAPAPGLEAPPEAPSELPSDAAPDAPPDPPSD
jgi:hypothetical protein